MYSVVMLGSCMFFFRPWLLIVHTLFRYEISRAFVLNGARVIMVNRKEDQGQAAVEQIKKEAGQDAKIEWMPCDMGNFKEIKEVFTGFREREERLDLVPVFTMKILKVHTKILLR